MSMELAGVSGSAPVKINKLLLRITAMASGRAFVGPKLWHEEEYIDNAINFTTDVMMAVASVAFLPVWLRPVLSPIMPLVRALHRRIQSEKKLMYPVVLSRRELGATMGSSMKPDDLLEWLIDNTAGADVEPDVAAMLLEEVREVLGKHEGKFTLQSLQELKKMDSFAKETMRYYPLMAASVQRKVLKPFALSNGQVVPAGVIIECANKAICDDPATRRALLRSV
ncbi:cytochrome P450 [Metarhizium robertsii]|uniref:Cytochrome P450 CYP54C6 n=2 Tax=Metarhizium robertsii TaxID=568076 RepID=E9F4D7_METRA|nr:Cytochrome P450 CYP54C6 [Metarhizium robertsii ARSEF 23]EFY97494.2 Cytochrome P450 CYP54C6 [Metarhizium robertsii ARSEF 23]EXU99692.1 cytochrome P450 [Metarhizium robertsii]